MSPNGQPQLTNEQIGQLLEYLKQQVPQTAPVMNWNIPTNPMAAMWMNNMMNMMSNQNQNMTQQQQQQNQNNQPLQQPQQTEDTSPAVRMVNSPDEIKADEIPMNGSIRLFLQEDMNVIYGKRWTNNGTIENIRYVREKDQNEEAVQQNDPRTTMDYDALIQGISNMVDQKLEEFRKEYNLKQKTSSSKSVKKEVVEDGE